MSWLTTGTGGRPCNGNQELVPLSDRCDACPCRGMRVSMLGGRTEVAKMAASEPGNKRRHCGDERWDQYKGTTSPLHATTGHGVARIP